jgi:hypothetical protein
MTKGLRKVPKGGAPEPKGDATKPRDDVFTFECLTDPNDRARFGWTKGRDKEPIQLKCDSCHRLDLTDEAGISWAAASPAGQRPPGDAMLPVTYENDCRACHPLPIDPNDPKRTIRHGLEPREIVEQLTWLYTAQAVEKDPDLLGRFVPSRPMPGRPVSEEASRAKKAAEDKTLVALKRLFGAAVDEKVRSGQCLPLGRGGCVECHELTPKSQPLVDLKAASTLDTKPVVVRSLWYEGAVFNHATHRALECASCHAGASESKDQDHLLLPDAGQCVSCHAPATTEGGRPRGGASTSCVECHRYHNDDHPAQGIGATARRGTAEMTVDQFLNGGPRRGE